MDRVDLSSFWFGYWKYKITVIKLFIEELKFISLNSERWKFYTKRQEIDGGLLFVWSYGIRLNRDDTGRTS